MRCAAPLMNEIRFVSYKKELESNELYGKIINNILNRGY